MEDNMPNFSEYTVERKRDPRLRRIKAGIVALYVLFSVCFFLLCYKLAFIPLFAVVPMLLYIVHRIVWRFTEPEYIYRFRSGEISFFVKYDRRPEKKIASFNVRDSKVGPFNAMENRKSKKVTDLRSAPDSPDGYYVDNGNICVFFDATKNLVRLMSRFNPDIPVSDNLRF